MISFQNANALFLPGSLPNETTTSVVKIQYIDNAGERPSTDHEHLALDIEALILVAGRACGVW